MPHIVMDLIEGMPKVTVRTAGGSREIVLLENERLGGRRHQAGGLSFRTFDSLLPENSVY